MAQNSQPYYKQLDSLRAIAVLLVIISHWFSENHFLNRYSNNGVLGVTLFFVLSGFLITGILLKSKNGIDTGGSIKEAFKVFYVRRSLRIFPVYYLLLLILFFFNLGNIQESFWWHFLYGSNFYFWIKGGFEGALSHFWSLAVEEQFYLIWPAIILFTPRLFLKHVLVGGVLFAVIFRYFIISENGEIGRILMPGSLDSFCLGGLFAVFRNKSSQAYNYFKAKKTLMATIAISLLIISHIPTFKLLPRNLYYSIYLFLISVSFAIIIDLVCNDIKLPVIKHILDNPILLYIGRISYGIYLFHNFIPYFYGINLSFLPEIFSVYAIQLMRFLLLLLLASLSWYLYEKQILKLKSYFQYS